MRGERGFALIAALWLLVALAAVAAAVSLQARERRLAAVNAVEGARATAAALGGLQHAQARLDQLLARDLRSGPRGITSIDPWSEAAALLGDTVALGEARYRVELHDPAARLHLNRASEQELRRLLIALRIDAGDADRLAQSIADWRDADGLRHVRGAEREQYLEDGSLVLPADRPFTSPSELRDVRGMTPSLLDRVTPHLTLAGSGQINFNSASREVLLSLDGMTEAAVQLLMRHRASRRPVSSLLELQNELPSGPKAVLQEHLSYLLSRTVVETRELEVASEGWLDGGVVRVEARGLMVRGGNVTVLVWQEVE